MENEFVNFYIEDGILFGIYKKPFVMTLKTANVLLESRLALNKGKSYPALFDFGRVQYSDAETRDFLLGRGTELMLAAAFITKNVAFRLFLNSVFTVYTIRIPLKVFNDRGSAIAWLNQFKEKE